ncbi:LysR family transcriptional regulator [unidentified bacterial endosymbiont]|uniref:LysR family transcriptional regulator n=1 Tax=unidentified bacterial endosymbiont TaxID=2355 RepID=UPI00209E97C2|nr:LysR family transcriptional regulator [unidentified bacterial endosymbiont]
MKSEFDYNLIKVLDAVISAGNVTKASQRLSVTPAAVSIALNRLQGFYQETLFVRGRTGLVPTVKALEVHGRFCQAIDLIKTALKPEIKDTEQNNITLLGGDITENYYLSQIYDDKFFERFSFRHYSNRNREKAEMKRLLVMEECDIAISHECNNDSDFECKAIDSFKHFCVICGKDNLLSELSQLSLHNFFSAQHAVFKANDCPEMTIEDDNLYSNHVDVKERRVIGYKSDSLTGLIGIVERTQLIALIPLKVAIFFKNQRKYNINILQLPREMKVRQMNVYASWYKRNTKGQYIQEVVDMLHTLSAFRH